MMTKIAQYLWTKIAQLLKHENQNCTIVILENKSASKHFTKLAIWGRGILRRIYEISNLQNFKNYPVKLVYHDFAPKIPTPPGDKSFSILKRDHLWVVIGLHPRSHQSLLLIVTCLDVYGFCECWRQWKAALLLLLETGLALWKWFHRFSCEHANGSAISFSLSLWN